MPRLPRPLRSLESRLFVPLALTTCVVLALHAALAFRSTREHYSRFVQAEIERSSALIMGATHDGMLLNKLDELQQTLERLAQAPEIASIRVYNTDGRIVLSHDPAERGRMLPADSETCRSCHKEPGTATDGTLERRLHLRQAGGHEIHRRLTVVANEPGCSTADCHFHPPEKAVLGVLDVGMSTQPFEATIEASQAQLVWTTLLLIVIGGAISAVFIRHVVHTPVLRLHEGTRRIAAGDLDTPLEVRGDNELSRLAEAFNRMQNELRDAREELTEWSRTLEQKVEAKTKALHLAERQVLHMETMASLGKLSATVAHELNNPLSGILTYARLIKRELADQRLDGPVREELERYLNLVDKECSRCGAIVHNLLTFARRRGGEMARVDVREVVERGLMLVRHHLEMRNIRLRVETGASDTALTADAGQLEQALLALLMNAIEAMPPAEGVERTLTVRLAGDAEGLLIEVADTGVGIPPDALPHIFEPFFSTKGGESGVGLGLAVVYGIVNRHGGTIDVETEVGKGTTFRMRLPRSRQEPGEADAPATAPAIAAGAGGG